jgi:hypothetical protein
VIRWTPQNTAVAVVVLVGLTFGLVGCHGDSSGYPSTSKPATTSGSVPGDTAYPSVVPELRSGLPWRSGVYLPGSSKAKAEQFASWRNRPLDVVIDWSARANWNDVVNPSWLYNLWQNTPYTKVFGVAMVPEEDHSATMKGCAAGDYNARWREFGRVIKSRGFDENTIIRLGWEFNGDWYKWSAYDPALYVNCWRNIVTTVEEQAPKLRWDWTVNRGEGSSVEDARKAYPGDDYVDIIGVDSYDAWPGATSQSAWREQYEGRFGLRFWGEFAAAHSKPLSVPEWGVSLGHQFRGHNGGDNAFYMSKMTEFFRANASRLAYEAYFNEPDPYFSSAVFDPVQTPKASAAYLKAYRP